MDWKQTNGWEQARRKGAARGGRQAGQHAGRSARVGRKSPSVPLPVFMHVLDVSHFTRWSDPCQRG